MWLFYTTCSFALFSYFGYTIYRKFYPLKFKTFDDVYLDDEYTFLCVKIKFEDGSDKQISEEILQEEIDEFHEKNAIKYTIIEYMFNGKFMKYLSYDRDITFPIYSFNVTPTVYPYYPETVLLNGEDITCYISPFLGPLCNFYLDRGNPMSLEDVLMEHPDIDKLDLKEGTLEFISSETPYEGVKHITKELPCRLIWKRHAAVDPINDIKIADEHGIKIMSKFLTMEDFEMIEKNK